MYFHKTFVDLKYWDVDLLKFLNLENIKHDRLDVLKLLCDKLKTNNMYVKSEFMRICIRKNIKKNYYIKSWHTGLINLSSYHLLTKCMLNIVLLEFSRKTKEHSDIIRLIYQNKGNKVSSIDI